MAVNPALFALGRMTVSSSGPGTITLNVAAPGFLTYELAGISTASSGQYISYAIVDAGTASEGGVGLYTSSSKTLTRGSSSEGLKSTNSDSPINMSNSAQVLITPMVHNFAPPTQRILTSESTYDVPLNVRALLIELYGGGGGGAGSGIAAAVAASSGGTTSFGGSSFAAQGGVGGAPINGGVGGTAAGGDRDWTGARGCDASFASNTDGIAPGLAGSGAGGATGLGGAGPGAVGLTLSKFNAQANTGSGGGGATTNSTAGNAFAGGGGGAGGYSRKLLTPSSSKYTITIGSGGTGGTAGASGTSGGNGGSGVILVTEFYS